MDSVPLLNIVGVAGGVPQGGRVGVVKANNRDLRDNSRLNRETLS
jgi:hypothetical protein